MVTENQTFQDPEYWRRRRVLDMGRPPLRPRDKACDDCPTKTMYASICAGLAQQPKDQRRWHSERWFCHESRDRACRGNWDLQKLGEP